MALVIPGFDALALFIVLRTMQMLRFASKVSSDCVGLMCFVYVILVHFGVYFMHDFAWTYTILSAAQ
jgi:hypothetical protein